jgi:DNA/RNA-binding domain of Phe-tRNA-synthetase-like protein
MLIVTDTWKAAYPGAAAGALLMQHVANPEQHPALEEKKTLLEQTLRTQFAGWNRAEFVALPSVAPYVAYYARFKKTYHVLLQLESVVLKGKSLPSVAALVEVMFMSELQNHLLTAVHDWAAIEGPVRLDAATGAERYLSLGGQEQTLKPGDMFMADAQGVISSVIYGPDARTRITPETTSALFTVYAPPGIDAAAVDQHLHDIATYAQLIAPEAEVATLAVYRAG